MKNKISRQLLTLSLCCVALLFSNDLLAAPSIDVLLIDGQNNHNWRKTTPVLKAILEDTGLFRVDVVTTPKDVSQFRPDFLKYSVVVSNYNGAVWPEETRQAFAEFVRDGGGFVPVHAANNAFPKWKEYNEMIALGGWGGRNHKSGPWVHWENGQFVRDTSRGPGGGHGKRHSFQITTRDTSHAITAGLPPIWMHARDELYSNMRGPAENMTILATAYSDPETNGTGRHEPLLLTVNYGKGRVFHTMLGHDVEAMDCVGFAFTLQRGVEWAARGKVTLEEVPDNFPTADHVRSRLSNTAFESILTYDFGGDRRGMTAIEEALRGASPRTLAEIEIKLIAVLESPETRYAGKQFALRVLRRIGSDVCVPHVEALLLDKRLSHNARLVLQHIPAAEATAALLRALPECSDDLRMGMVSSIGARRDRAAVGEIAALLGDADVALVRAAMRALGRCGGKDAVAALRDVTVSEKLERERDNALLACAESLHAEKETAAALDIYRVLADDTTRDSLVRIAAHRGMLVVEGGEAVLQVFALLNSDDRRMRQSAKGLLNSVPGPSISRAIAEELPVRDAAMQLLLIEILVDRRDRIAYPAIAALLHSADSKVRIAAIEALGTLGPASAVNRLADLTRAEGEVRQSALKSLATVRGEGVVPAIVKLTSDADPKMRVVGVSVLNARQDRTAIPALLAVVDDSDPSVRAAAHQALGRLGGSEEFLRVAKMLIESDDAGDRQTLATALRQIAGRVRDKDASARSLVKMFAGFDIEGQARLLAVFGEYATPFALEFVRGHAKSDDPRLSEAAAHALIGWQNEAALPDVLALAEESDDAAVRTRARENFSRMLATPSGRPARETAPLLAKVLDLAPSAKERKAVLKEFSRYPCEEALALAEARAQDPKLGKTARKVAASIRGDLIRESLTATASHRPDRVRNAFDNDPNTRWDTGTSMKAGMWFQLDLGEECTVSRIVLDTRKSPGDFPRGCEVYASLDGEEWGKPVYSTPPQRPITRLKFPEPVRGRYFKIVQTRDIKGMFWSIHELRVVFE